MAAVDVDQVDWQHVDGGPMGFQEVGYVTEDTKDGEETSAVVVDCQDAAGSSMSDSDAPIVIFPNDPTSLVGAEEVVMEEVLEWTLDQDVEESEVVVGEDDHNFKLDDDFPDIPLSSLSSVLPFPCDFCNRRFKRKANLMNHMVAHQTQRPHACSICSSRFMRKCDLVNHLKIHSYLPNRENRDHMHLDPTLDSIDPMPFKSYSTTKRKRQVSSSGDGSSRRTLGRQTPPPKSPSHAPSPDKSNNYIEEDVKLLLEMTNKLQDSHPSEDEMGSAILEPDTAKSQSSVSKSKPYECSVCKRCFARESALNSHSQVHGGEVAYNCKKCNARFFSKKMLSEHLSKKHNMRYSDEEEGPMNTRGYTGDERFGSYYCKLCAISFHQQDEFKLHKRTLHPAGQQEGLFRCYSCSLLFKSHGKLLVHLNVSMDCQQHVCLLCGENFADQTTTQAHIRRFHARDMPPHTCDYCGKKCTSSHSLRQHFWQHQIEKRYTCNHPSCPKKFSTWEQLRRHSATHEVDTVEECGECKEKFPDNKSLENHLRVHRSGNFSARRFFCNECGKSFGSRSSQQIHNRIHTGEKPYGCRYCWKAFADGGTLRKHERIHTGEKPYACAVCPRAFNQRVVLREHIRSHHSGLVNKTGRSEPVYLCPVCNIECDSSDELGAHIIKHCDANTHNNRTQSNAKKRVKPVLSKDSLQSELPPINSETDSADSDSKTGDGLKEKRRRKPSFSAFNRTYDDRLSVFPMLDPTPKKAKMINTKLLTSRGGKRGPNKKSRVVEVSTVVYPRPRTRTLSGRLSGQGDVAPSDAIGDKIVNGRPRTKNVSYETLRALRKGYEAATFPEIANVDEIKDEPMSDESSSHVQEEGEQACHICRHICTSRSDYLSHVQLHI